jgi:hypothetical protein
MNEVKSSHIDRQAAGWGSGPWDDEPDRIDWVDEKTGLKCRIVRQEAHGYLCGYVGVPVGHVLHCVYKDDLNVQPKVHGGLYFSNYWEYDDSPGHDETWWFGFECGWMLDESPRWARLQTENPPTYRDINYVRQELLNLAEQLAAKQA